MMSAFMLLGGLHPMLWVLMPGLIALFTGIPFLLMCAKVQKPGAVLLMGIITGLIYFVTGQFTVIILITFVIGCGLAELARWGSRYGSFRGNTLAFVFFSLGMVEMCIRDRCRPASLWQNTEMRCARPNGSPALKR